MYCRRCGKQIDYLAEVCLDCQRELLGATIAAEESGESASPPPVAQITPAPAPQEAPAEKLPPSRFGLALASTIIGGTCAFLNVYLDIIVLVIILASSSARRGISPGLIVEWMFFISIAVLALVFGIVSVTHYEKHLKKYGKKFVATKVLGTIGIATSSYVLFWAGYFILLFLV